MDSGQLTFFDLAPSATEVDPRPKVKASRLVRRSDPETSREAAEKVVDSGKYQTDFQDTADLVREHPGRTRYELEKLDQSIIGRGHGGPERISKRLKDVERAGLIFKGKKRQCFEHGTQCATWYPAE